MLNGQKVREIRQTLGWTLMDLAAKIGSTPGKLSKLETTDAKENDPYLSTVVAIARAFQVDVDKLIAGPEVPLKKYRRTKEVDKRRPTIKPISVLTSGQKRVRKT